MWKFIELLESLVIIFLFFYFSFSWFTYFVQVTWNYWSSLLILDNILFFAWCLVLRGLIKINNLFGIFFKSFSHNVIFFKGQVFDHSFKMKFLFWNIFFSLQFFFNFSFSYLIIKLSDNFCFHVLFLLLFCKASPIKFTIFSEELLALLNFWKIHR